MNIKRKLIVMIAVIILICIGTSGCGKEENIDELNTLAFEALLRGDMESFYEAANKLYFVKDSLNLSETAMENIFDSESMVYARTERGTVAYLTSYLFMSLRNDTTVILEDLFPLFYNKIIELDGPRLVSTKNFFSWFFYDGCECSPEKLCLLAKLLDDERPLYPELYEEDYHDMLQNRDKGILTLELLSLQSECYMYAGNEKMENAVVDIINEIVSKTADIWKDDT